MKKAACTTLAAVGLALCQCVSGPSLKRHVELGETDKVAVVYQQPRSNFSQTLLSDNIVDAQQFYSDSDSDKFSKILSAEGMQLLLDGLATVGYFDNASPVPAPDASAHLLVRINETSYSWSATRSMTSGDAQKFIDAVGTFQNVFNATLSFHTSTGDSTVLDEHRRIQQRNQSILKSSERK